MKQEQLEKKIEEQLTRFEHAIELPINTETGERMSFVRDGIVNVSKYLEAPVKILWILKEAHSDDDSLPDMRPNLASLNDNDNPDIMDRLWAPTWRAVAYATYGIFENMNMDDIPEMNGNAQEVLKYMPCIAHINVKKYAGGSNANMSEIQRFYNKYKTLLHEQVEIIDPEVMIFGGTFGCFSDYFVGKEKIAEWLPVYQFQNKLLIDTYHPSGYGRAGMTQIEYCDYIINAVKDYMSLE